VSLLHFAPALLGKLTNFFFTASNRIVKDPRALPPPYRIRKPTAGLETCFARSDPTQGRPARKLKNLIKNQTGRPYSAPRGGPREVLLPFLKEDLLLPHPTSRWRAPAPVFCDPQLGDSIRISESAPRCKANCKKDWTPDSAPSSQGSPARVLRTFDLA